MLMERSQSTGLRSSSSSSVVAIECLTESCKAEEWNGEMPQTGDVVEELRMGGGGGGGSGGGGDQHGPVPSILRAPFKNGRAGLQRLLHSAFKRKDTSVLVRVRRGIDQFTELHACIVPCDTPSSGATRRPTYLLRSIKDQNYAVTFADRTEAECMALQGSRSSRVACALSRAKLQDGYVSYPWEKKMRETLQVPNSSAFLSLLLLPKVSDQATTRYNDLDDTLARANAWLNASQASGVPIVFMNIQTEALLTKISGETASSTVNTGSLSDLSNLANASLYGFEDYHGVDIGVVRAVRLWYAPIAGEVAIEIKLREGDSRLGFAISRTEEGFIYVSSVADDADKDVAAIRSGLREVYMEALKSSKLLVISRLSNEKVLPWLVSPSGAVRCYDTISLSRKLSLHRHALRPILLQLFIWDRSLASDIAQTMSRPGRPHLPLQHSPTTTHYLQQHPDPPATEQAQDHLADDEPAGSRVVRDTAGDLSFRFHNFAISTNWV